MESKNGENGKLFSKKLDIAKELAYTNLVINENELIMIIFYITEIIRSQTKEANMNLLDAQIGEEYIIKEILTDDEEMDAFLFRLGCYSGEPITVVSRKKGGCVVSIKDGRYNIDNLLAEAIVV